MEILVGPDDIVAVIPDWLPSKGWSLHNKGYLIYTSRSKTSGIRRGARAHRVVMEKIIGRALEPGEQVHHQNFDKLRNCGCNLILMPYYFNPTSALQCPITGDFMSRAEYFERYGAIERINEPDWVTGDYNGED